MRQPEPARRPPLSVRTRMTFALCIFGSFASVFAVLLGAVLALACMRARRVLLWTALAGGVLGAALAPAAVGQGSAAVTGFFSPNASSSRSHHMRTHRRRHHRHHRRRHRRQASGTAAPVSPLPKLEDSWHAAWPHLRTYWLLFLPLAGPFGLLFDLIRPRGLSEDHRRSERRDERALDRRRETAAKRAAKLAEPNREPALRPGTNVALLGTKVSGERVLPERRGRVGVPLDWLGKPTLVIGPSGSGKTETLMRLAYGGAAVGGLSVYYIDAKADRAGARRFAGLMQMAGRRCAVFPDTPLDCWRGDGRALYNRLIELVAFATEGDGAYYRDVAKSCLWVACCGPDRAPRSAAELRDRLGAEYLLAHDLRGELAKLGQRELSGVALRYGSFFDSLGDSLDSGFGFEDVDSAYVMLDSLALKEDANSLARLVIEDFAHFATQRKRPERKAVLIVDELSAIADAARVVDLVERMRSFGVGVILAPQVESGMGTDESVSDRIVQNSETVFLHALKRPEALVELAGTRRQVEASWQHEYGAATGAGSGRVQHVFKVDPNEVRSLRAGECFVIREGSAVRVQVARAPAAAPTRVAARPDRPRPAVVQEPTAAPAPRLPL